MNRPKPQKQKRLKHENHLALLALIGAAPAVALSITFVWLSSYSVSTCWTLTAFILIFLWGGFAAFRHRARFPLQTLANLVAAIREGDFSTRARGGSSTDAMGELAFEINALAAHLRDQRFDSVEAAALLRTVMAEIDVAVFAFDPNHRLVLLNRAGERVLARRSEQSIGRNASELGFLECLQGEANR